ncbi:unnamed protein product [Cuscuta campestris]|uniref:SWIM-type domain-containing protein n=1 Tax=Cuscuta campestris TaxID=132261 RepID=A0A484LZL5_9ASTE|nr:unnamed protein product [Cuscuta campestris]
MFFSLLASVSSIDPVFSTPSAIHSLLQFDGKWDVHGVFSYTYAYEIQIPHQASFTDLLQQEIATMKEMHNTSRFDPTRIVVDAIYASNKDLDIHLKIDMRREHVIAMTYKKAWFAKEKALEICFGTVQESYAALPSMCFMLKQANPGSLIELTTTPDHLFKVKQALKHRPVEYIVSGRHDGIIKAVKSIFPKARHVHCIFHIFGNIKTNFHGSEKSLSWKFYGAARAASEAECDRYLKYLDSDDPRIIGYLKAIRKEKWARSCSNQRYSIMTSNLAESVNNIDAVPREYPIIQLVDFLIGRTQRWFHERRELANSTSSTLTKFYESELNELHFPSAVMEVRTSCAFEFIVIDKNGHSFVVNFQNMTCTCCEFQLDHFVCVHAIAATRCRSSLSCYDYVSSFYTTTAWRATYFGIIHPIPSKESWIVPDEVAEVVCLPTSCDKRPPGRPKKRRIPSKGEHAKRQSCSRCKSSSHNRKTCSNPISLSRA